MVDEAGLDCPIYTIELEYDAHPQPEWAVGAVGGRWRKQAYTKEKSAESLEGRHYRCGQDVTRAFRGGVVRALSAGRLKMQKRMA